MFLDTKIPTHILDDGAIVDSPSSPNRSAAPSPLRLTKDLPATTVRTSLDESRAITASPLPAEPAAATSERKSNAAGPPGTEGKGHADALPASAQDPEKLVQIKSTLVVEEPANNDRETGNHEITNGSRNSTEEQPEGTGSRRMFQLSKKFSMFPFVPLHPLLLPFPTHSLVVRAEITLALEK